MSRLRKPRSEDSDTELDPDAARVALVRRILGMIGMPKRCREGSCRRSGRCVGPTIRCQRDFPVPKGTPEEERANIATIYKAIRARAAECEAMESDEPLTVPEPARRQPAPASRDKARGTSPLGSRPSGRR